MERYPLILDGAASGSVSVHREGGWTVFDAQCDSVQGIVRISVYGEGREGYLGILEPEAGKFALHRRLSRSAMREFPVRIEYAGPAGQSAAAEGVPEPPECMAEAPEQTPPEPVPEQPPNREEDRNETPPELEDVYWYASPDGALVCFDGEQNLIALPVGDERIPDGPGGWPRTIEGQEYIVYRTKDGRLIR